MQTSRIRRLLCHRRTFTHCGRCIASRGCFGGDLGILLLGGAGNGKDGESRELLSWKSTKDSSPDISASFDPKEAMSEMLELVVAITETGIPRVRRNQMT